MWVMQMTISFQADRPYLVNVELEDTSVAVGKDKITDVFRERCQFFVLPVQVFLCTQSQASLM